jgi:hypothetical protein
MSTGSTPHDISVQPGPSSFYIQTPSVAADMEVTPAISKPADLAPVEHPRKKKKVSQRLVSHVELVSVLLYVWNDCRQNSEAWLF